MNVRSESEEIMSKRLAEVVAIRDHVCNIMRTEGKWSEVSGIKAFMWERDGFTATLNTPFNPLPTAAPPISSYQDAALFQRARTPQPNQLSLWKGKKVLSVEWANGGPPGIISFRRGDWERQLLAIK
jgi:hypothetical protein